MSQINTNYHELSEHIRNTMDLEVSETKKRCTRLDAPLSYYKDFTLR